MLPPGDAAAQIRKLKAQIGQFKGQITRANKFATEQQEQVLVDADAVQMRIQVLRSALLTYRDNQLNLQLLLNTGDDPDMEEDEVEELCFTAISELQKVVNSTLDHSSVSKEANQPLEGAISRKLPTLELPTFDGKEIVQYKSFIDMFLAVIGSDNSLASVQKLFYLRKYLKADALALIEGLPLVNESYTQALALLKNRYDNKCILITHHINILLDLQPISKGTAQNLRHLVSQARQQIGALKGLGQKVEYWDMVIVTILIRKLDSYSCRAYFTERDQVSLPTLNEFLEFVEKRALSFEESQQTEGKSHPFSKSQARVNNHASVSPVSCKFCQSADHKLYLCKKFQLLSIDEKLEFVDKNNICKICLNFHKNKCKFFFKCEVCKSKTHHTVLHKEEAKKKEEQLCCQNSTTSTNMILLPTIKVKIYSETGSCIIAKGLLDSGSQTSFITSNLMRKLCLPTFKHEVKISALGQKEKLITKAANIMINSLHDDYNCNALFSVVDNITSFLPQSKFDLKDIEFPNNIKLADNEFNVPGQISFLLSSEVFFKIMLPDKIELNGGNLCLLSTKFGYVLSGNIKRENICLTSINEHKVVLHATTIQTENVDLLLQQFWEEQHTPEINKEDIVKPDICEAEFKNSVQLINNRFQVRLPLKVPIEELHLGDSFTLALQRLNNLTKRFNKNPELKEAYSEFIREYVDLGHAEIIDLASSTTPIDQFYFMPHHPIIRKDSKTTKLRVVFDASAKAKSNLSLNDVLHNGPVVQKGLFEILILFRSYEFIALCDVRQMYRQIRTDPSQNNLQNILWRSRIDDKLLCLQLQTVTYGVKSSSFLATRCLVELALRYGEQYPLAAKVLINNTYIDDCIFGAPSIAELKKVCDELIELLRLGSFELHKWSSNNHKILSNIPRDKQVFDKDHQFKSGHAVLKALGLCLDVNKDQLRICRPEGEVPQEWTKRTVLSCIGTFFDPLGLAGPIVTKAKHFMQKLWKEKLDWDSPLTNELLLSWNRFFSDLMNMEPIIVNRNLKISNADHIDLVGYCDASNIAFGCCLYVRTIHGKEVHVSLVCSKSRIAPINAKLTMPKLELNGAVVLSKLFSKVKSVFKDINFRRKYMFTDSQIVLWWLKSIKNSPYVQNRVNTINNLTKECEWFHVNGSNNPADCLSRGLNPTQLSSHDIWWRGPQELYEINFIPKEITLSKFFDSDSNNVAVVNCDVQQELLPISNVSTLVRLQRIFAYVLRFIKNCKISKDKRNLENLSVTEIKESMSCLIKYVQSLHFADELKCIRNGSPIRTNIKGLNPFLDKLGIMRVAGRLENANLPYNQRCPIILPNKCHLTTIIIRNEHLSLLHSGLKLTLSSLIQKYYIVSAVREIKKVVHKCTVCFKFRAQRARQLMGTLPHSRVNQDKIWNHIGIDYCGPFQIKQSTLRRSIISKGYVLVIVCFATKCIHLELVSDLTTECFLAAFKRFCSRRGTPSVVYCDNASTYKGANNQLRQLYLLNNTQQHKDSVLNYCATKDIEFKFIPSYSPTFGGLWEASVKLFKHHYRRVVGSMCLTYEQFNTIVVQIEGTLNSRPLTQLSNDVNDLSFLTPAHFLCGRPLNAIPEPDLTSMNINRLKFWKKCIKIQQDFWRAWHKDYLSQFLRRSKWHNANPNIKIGDLVLLIGENCSPLQWPMARVINLFSGSDGLVRVIEVKTGRGTHRRAINKVAVLPIDRED